MMKRSAIIVLLILMTSSMAFSRTITPEIGIGFQYPIWSDFEGYTLDDPSGGPGISLSLWMEASPSLQLGVEAFFADYNQELFGTETSDYIASIDDPKGWGLAAATRYSEQSWSTLGFQPYVHTGLVYHRLRWTERSGQQGFGMLGVPNTTTTTHPNLNQGAISAGVGLMRGERIGFHMMLEAEYQLTVINRSRRADYLSVVLGFGF